MFVRKAHGQTFHERIPFLNPVIFRNKAVFVDFPIGCAVFGAKGRDAGLGGNARAGEDDDVVNVGYGSRLGACWSVSQRRIDRDRSEGEHGKMRSTPVLANRIIASLRAIGSKLEAGGSLGVEVAESVRALDRVDPRDLPQVEREIVEAAALHRWHHEPSLMEKLFASRVLNADQLRSVERLEFLFLFHRDG